MSPLATSFYLNISLSWNMKSGENKKIILLRNVSVILCGINGFLPFLLYYLASLAYFGSSILVIIGITSMLAFAFYNTLPFFIIPIILIICIPLTMYKKYNSASWLSGICGFLTFPLGILGLIAMVLIDKLSTKEIIQQKADFENKKYNRQQAQMREKKYCSTCCLSLRYIERHSRYYCDNCDKYE